MYPPEFRLTIHDIPLAVGLYSKGMNCNTEIPSYSILVLKDQYNLCISDVRTEYLPLKLPINNNEDDVVEMYKEYFKRKPQVKQILQDSVVQK
jgi:hypothetical protein